MADLTSAEVTVVSSVPIGAGEGNGYRLLQVYLDHTFVSGDELSTADLGVDAIVGIVGCGAIDSTDSEFQVDAADWPALVLSKQLDLAAKASGTSQGIASPAGEDLIIFPAAWATHLGGYLSLIVKV
jgi:hypothetical protein